MSTILQNLNSKAIQLGIPLAVHLDVTWRCNERCVHCYLDHDDLGEMTYDEIEGLLTQMAGAGVFFLTISGGEPLLRRDLFAIIRRARDLTFNVKLKTNGILIHEQGSRADSRAWRRDRAGQHLLPSSRGSRRDHEG